MCFLQGVVVECDDQFAYIHGYTDPVEVQGTALKDLIPALQLPEPGKPITKVRLGLEAQGKNSS